MRHRLRNSCRSAVQPHGVTPLTMDRALKSRGNDWTQRRESRIVCTNSKESESAADTRDKGPLGGRRRLKSRRCMHHPRRQVDDSVQRVPHAKVPDDRIPWPFERLNSNARPPDIDVSESAHHTETLTSAKGYQADAKTAHGPATKSRCNPQGRSRSTGGDARLALRSFETRHEHTRERCMPRTFIVHDGETESERGQESGELQSTTC